MKKKVLLAMAVMAGVAAGYAQEKDGQWNRPYNAYGSKLLSSDILAGRSAEDATLQGNEVYYYDSEGREIGYDAIYPQSVDDEGNMEFIKIHNEEDDSHFINEEYLKAADGGWYMTRSESSVLYNGKAVEGETREWDGETLVTKERLTSEFDEKGRPTQTVTERISEYTGALSPKQKTTYEYDTDGIPFVSNYYRIGTSEIWYPQDRTKTYTDENGGVTNENYVWASWYNPAGEWVGTSKTYKLYNKSHMTELEKSWKFDYETRDWADAGRVEYTYNGLGRLVTRKYYEWMSEIGGWYLKEDNLFLYQGDSLECGTERIWQEPVFDGEKYQLHKYGEKDEFFYADQEDYSMYASYTLEQKEGVWYWRGEDKCEQWNSADAHKAVTYVWSDENDVWLPGAMNIVKSDEQGRCWYSETQGWNQEISDWYVMYREVEKYMYVGDERFFVLKESYNGLTPYGERKVYTYDDMMRQTSDYRYVYNETDGDWMLYSYVETQYDEDGKILAGTELYFNAILYDGWKYLNSYDEDGNIVKRDWYICIGGSILNPTWQIDTSSEMTYDSMGHLLTEELKWDTNGILAVVYRNEYTYNESGEVICFEHYEPLYSPDSMTLCERTEYEYGTGDMAHVMIHSVRNRLSPETLEWGKYDEVLVRVEGNDTITDTFGWMDRERTQWALVSSDKKSTDPETGRLTVENSSYDWYTNVVAPYRKTTIGLNEAGDTLYWETCDWNSYDMKWQGNTKFERGYDVDGQKIMQADYYWDSYASDWRGSSKTVEIKDKSGRRTYYESYTWNWDGEWQGVSKEEYAYGRNGQIIMQALYYWNNASKSFIGLDKFENISTENYSMRASYTWDIDSMCWVGISKRVSGEEPDGTRIEETYEWDSDARDWRGSEKSGSRRWETDYTTGWEETAYLWDDESRQWKGNMRETCLQKWNSSFNQEYMTYIIEKFDATTDGWMPHAYFSQIYVYDPETRVPGVLMKSDALIRVGEGCISVDAPAGAEVTVRTLGGITLGRGTGSLECVAPAGVCVVTVGGVSTKVLVR